MVGISIAENLPTNKNYTAENGEFTFSSYSKLDELGSEFLVTFNAHESER